MREHRQKAREWVKIKKNNNNDNEWIEQEKVYKQQ